ncbi:MFS transporter [Maricaulis sp.]|uniref:MFS transporter n=1 Tax=Maricaulis sp. TaxID=1486257 RepID=UPI0026020BC6|nr:MFS transporter [Maricaulis sp.]
MSQTATKTRPEDRVSFAHRLAYGSGAFANNLLAGVFGGLAIVLNLGLGMDPVLAGIATGLLPRMFDAFTDPVMGYVSDNTQTRWGRRRPYIFVGAILVAIALALVWQMPDGQSDSFYFWWFLVGSLAFYLAYTVFATPWVALGYELTPDYDERSRLMGTQNFIGQLAYFIPPWLLAIMTYEPLFENMVDGAAAVALVTAVLVLCLGLVPAIFLRERLAGIAAKESAARHTDKLSGIRALFRTVGDFFKSFVAALSFVPFLKLCLATFLIFNGFIMIAAFQTYVIIYYVMGGDQAAGALWAGYAGTVATFATFGVVAFVAWLATKIGKRRAFAVSTGISMLGYLAKWFCYNPEVPWLVLLPGPLLAFGLGGLFTLMPSMMADVVDLDELKTHERREGMFGSMYWWVVKLGMSVALVGGGFLLNATGFDVDLGAEQSEQTLLMLRIFDVGVPFIASAIAIYTISTLDVTRETMHQVRLKLESRRGVPDAVPAE